MRERREVAGGADRALRRHLWQQILVKHLLQHLDYRSADTRSALGEAGQLQYHHQPHDCRGRRDADPSGMGQHDVTL